MGSTPTFGQGAIQVMTASTRSVVTAAGATALAATAFVRVDPPLVGLIPALLLGVGAAVFAAGWPRLLGVPAQRGSSVVIALTGWAALGSAVLTQMFSYLPAILAGGVIAAFVHQMLRKDGRPRLVESLSATVAGVIVAVFAAGWVTTITRFLQADARAHPNPTALILTAACALTVACVATAFTPRAIAGTAATLAAGVLGALLGWIFPAVGLVAGAALGACLGLLQSSVQHAFELFPSSRRVRPALSAALLPVLAAGVPVYTIARVIANLGV
ncbi:MAG: hypothetical protein Q4P36_01895 [Bowdeniella nasicola]|nr:hypothetical protein [Bowdeniella nasicola]